MRRILISLETNSTHAKEQFAVHLKNKLDQFAVQKKEVIENKIETETSGSMNVGEILLVFLSHVAVMGVIETLKLIVEQVNFRNAVVVELLSGEKVVVKGQGDLKMLEDRLKALLGQTSPTGGSSDGSVERKVDPSV